MAHFAVFYCFVVFALRYNDVGRERENVLTAFVVIILCNRCIDAVSIVEAVVLDKVHAFLHVRLQQANRIVEMYLDMPVRPN